MSIELPPELRWLSYLAGSSWPEGDEDKLFALSQDWTDSANSLNGIINPLHAAVDAALASYSGSGADQMKSQFDQFFSGDNSVESMVQGLEQLASSVFDMGTQTEYAKLQIIITLALMAAEIAYALSTLFGAWAVSLIEAEGAGIMRLIANRLIEELAARAVRIAERPLWKLTAIEALKQGGLGFGTDLLAQGIEDAQGHRHGINWVQAIESGVTGAVSAGVATPIGHFGGKYLGSLVGDSKMTWWKAGAIAVGSGIPAGLAGAGAGIVAYGVMTGNWEFNPAALIGGVGGGVVGGVHGVLGHAQSHLTAAREHLTSVGRYSGNDPAYHDGSTPYPEKSGASSTRPSSSSTSGGSFTEKNDDTASPGTNGNTRNGTSNIGGTRTETSGDSGIRNTTSTGDDSRNAASTNRSTRNGASTNDDLRIGSTRNGASDITDSRNGTPRGTIRDTGTSTTPSNPARSTPTRGASEQRIGSSSNPSRTSSPSTGGDNRTSLERTPIAQPTGQTVPERTSTPTSEATLSSRPQPSSTIGDGSTSHTNPLRTATDTSRNTTVTDTTPPRTASTPTDDIPFRSFTPGRDAESVYSEGDRDSVLNAENRDSGLNGTSSDTDSTHGDKDPVVSLTDTPGGDLRPTTEIGNDQGQNVSDPLTAEGGSSPIRGTGLSGDIAGKQQSSPFTAGEKDSDPVRRGTGATSGAGKSDDQPSEISANRKTPVSERPQVAGRASEPVRSQTSSEIRSSRAGKSDSDTAQQHTDIPAATREQRVGAAGKNWDEVTELGSEPRQLTKTAFSEGSPDAHDVVALGDESGAHYIWSKSGGLTRTDGRAVSKSETLDTVLADPTITDIRAPGTADRPPTAVPHDDPTASDPTAKSPRSNAAADRNTPEYALRARLADEASANDPRVIATREKLEQANTTRNAKHTELAAAEAHRDQQKSGPTAAGQAEHPKAEAGPARTRVDDEVSPDEAVARAQAEVHSANADYDTARAEHDATVQHAVQERYAELKAESDARLAADEQERAQFRADAEQRLNAAKRTLQREAKELQNTRNRYKDAAEELAATRKHNLDTALEEGRRQVQTAREALADKSKEFDEAVKGNEPRAEELARLRTEVDSRTGELRDALLEHEARLTAAGKQELAQELASAKTERGAITTKRGPADLWRRWTADRDVAKRTQHWRETLDDKKSEAAEQSKVNKLEHDLRQQEVAFAAVREDFEHESLSVIDHLQSALDTAKKADHDAYLAGLADKGPAMQEATRKAMDAGKAVVKAAFAYRDEVLRPTGEEDPVIKPPTDKEVDDMLLGGTRAQRTGAMAEWVARHNPAKYAPRETQMLAHVLGVADMKGGEGKTLVMVMNGYRDALEHGAATKLTASDPLVQDMIGEVLKYVDYPGSGVRVVQLKENEPFPEDAWAAKDKGEALLVIATPDTLNFSGLHESNTMLEDIANKAGADKETTKQTIADLREWLRTEPPMDEVAARLDKAAQDAGSDRRFRPVPDAVGDMDEVDTAFDGERKGILSPGETEDATPEDVTHLQRVYDQLRIGILDHGLTDKDFGRPANTTGQWHAHATNDAVRKLGEAIGREPTPEEIKHATQFALARWGVERGRDYNVSRTHDKIMLMNAKSNDKLSWDREKATETRLQGLGQYLDIVEGVTVRGNHPEDSLVMSLKQWIGSRFFTNPKGVSGTAKAVEEVMHEQWGGEKDVNGQYFGVTEINRFYDSNLDHQKPKEFDSRPKKLSGIAEDVVDAADISFTEKDGKIVGIEQKGRVQWSVHLDNSEIRGADERVTERVVTDADGNRKIEESRTGLTGYEDKTPQERGVADWVDEIVQRRLEKYAAEHNLQIADGVKLKYTTIDAKWYEEHGGGDAAETEFAHLTESKLPPGTIFFVNKSGARGTDPKPTQEALELGGVIARISGGPSFSERVVLQAVWRAARGSWFNKEKGITEGTPGTAIEYRSEEDYRGEIADARAVVEVRRFVNSAKARDDAAAALEAEPSDSNRDALAEAQREVENAERVLQEQTVPRLQQLAEDQMLAPHRRQSVDVSDDSHLSPSEGESRPSTSAGSSLTSETTPLAPSELSNWLSQNNTPRGTRLLFFTGKTPGADETPITSAEFTGDGNVLVRDTDDQGGHREYSVSRDGLPGLVQDRHIGTVTVVPAQQPQFLTARSARAPAPLTAAQSEHDTPADQTAPPPARPHSISDGSTQAPTQRPTPATNGSNGTEVGTHTPQHTRSLPGLGPIGQTPGAHPSVFQPQPDLSPPDSSHGAEHEIRTGPQRQSDSTRTDGSRPKPVSSAGIRIGSTTKTTTTSPVSNAPQDHSATATPHASSTTETPAPKRTPNKLTKKRPTTDTTKTPTTKPTPHDDTTRTPQTKRTRRKLTKDRPATKTPTPHTTHTTETPTPTTHDTDTTPTPKRTRRKLTKPQPVTNEHTTQGSVAKELLLRLLTIRLLFRQFSDYLTGGSETRPAVVHGTSEQVPARNTTTTRTDTPLALHASSATARMLAEAWRITPEFAEQFRVVGYNGKLYYARTGQLVHTPDNPVQRNGRPRGHLLVSDRHGNTYVSPDLGWVHTHEAFHDLGVYTAGTAEVLHGVLGNVTDYSGPYLSDRGRLTDLLDNGLAGVQRADGFQHLDHSGKPVTLARNTTSQQDTSKTTSAGDHIPESEAAKQASIAAADNEAAQIPTKTPLGTGHEELEIIIETPQQDVDTAKQVDEPAKQVDEPAKQVDEPAKQVDEPAKQVDEPAKQVDEPAKQVDEPAKQVDEPAK
ncbi:hypothetical protein, partial [Nocardia alni]|uniref:WXG100-like domain-containing protein n=1 Tax=Nocardia alni TaxID=2815723 RepID=UPI001C2100F3